MKSRLSDAVDRFLECVPDNRQVAFDDDGWRLKTDQSEHHDLERSESLAELHRWLDARSRSIRLADLLIEVENDLGFSAHFHRPGEKRIEPDEVCVLLAAILAHGCNLGLYTMEKIASGIPYRQLKRVGDWRLVEENQRAALASIVHGISRLDAASRWGDGKTSASDGQRFAMPHKVLQQTYSTRFNDFALEFYSFVADNYAPFYSRPIECTDRDAPFVLDGVLYHESDLDLEEHYTDTHGYTEINFAAFAMIGMRLCPRIRRLVEERVIHVVAEQLGAKKSEIALDSSLCRRSRRGLARHRRADHGVRGRIRLRNPRRGRREDRDGGSSNRAHRGEDHLRRGPGVRQGHSNRQRRRQGQQTAHARPKPTRGSRHVIDDAKRNHPRNGQDTSELDGERKNGDDRLGA